MAGQFIILEGGEGAGKTTLAKSLGETLRERGLEVISTREPGGTPWGERIRSLLIEKQSGIDHEMAPVTQLLGHYMARFEHLERVILPALKEGKIVISDRFEVSSFAYQVHAQEEGLEPLFKDLHAHVHRLLEPYKCTYLFCDVAPEIGLQRLIDGERTMNIFDEKPIDFHKRVEEGMKRAIFCINPHFHCVPIDAAASKEAMLKEALEKLGF